MIYEKGMATSRARMDWAGDSLSEAMANAITLNIEQGSKYLDTPTGSEYIWTGTYWRPTKLIDGGTLMQMNALDTTGYPLYNSFFFIYDATQVSCVYTLTQSGWRIL